METLVTGEIVFDDSCLPFVDADIYVRLQNVTRADASAETVAEQVLRHVSADRPAERSLRFALEGRLPSRRASYIVAVHVDVDGDGQISKGDCLTTQSYPVLTHGHPDEVRVEVTRI